ncbi:MAG: Asp-tRNA(Asn)/Glu-tRNA(Gln) amidotransferase subunit GatA [candidate division WOR-3 bacterium]|nr:Asp-tRNA(Asn)/Glu-tRNA(Gln) amidotransferase subunit GatA [candidate division WOR-3 bacterium]MCX7837379.1 Asp-tRNA(Asn)/Glu-tRNA(Gln) amidotransferase subunit GatA [candidate division WOR-3 bacterium]MDW8114006.1 Asp-tRNA(Asn)/Glu-tRNA(Gln) amidotransferase subunit GatA [candidate division WOR-3 bacterium]
MDILKLKIRDIQNLIKRKELSYMELIKEVFKRIEENKDLNAFISLFEEKAIKKAKECDKEFSEMKEVPNLLFGIPIAVKDNIAYAQERLTCASKILKDFVSPYSATAVERLEEKRAIIVGKTNLDEFAMGSSNEFSYFGPCLNPINREYVPGGSSGGSASAVGANIVPVALGSDTGGSVRQPAAFCGVCGLKPTYGRVSRFGLVAFASSLDVIGVFSKYVEDCALVLQTISGYDERDSTSANYPVPNYLPLKSNLEELKVGISKDFFFEEMDTSLIKIYEDFFKLLAKNGVRLYEVSLPTMKYGIYAYHLIATCEASSNLARYDGIRYGLNMEAKDIDEFYKKIRSEGFGKEVKRRIVLGTYGLSKGYYEEYYGIGVKARKIISQDFQRAFERVDIILAPPSPTLPFKLGEKLKDPIKMYLSDILTVPISLAGLPALSIPLKYKIDNFPISIQIIGKPFCEKEILDFAYGIEQL